MTYAELGLRLGLERSDCVRVLLAESVEVMASMGYYATAQMLAALRDLLDESDAGQPPGSEEQ